MFAIQVIDTAAPGWVKLYDTASTPGTGLESKMLVKGQLGTWFEPSAEYASYSQFGVPEGGVYFHEGIAIRITASALDTDATAVSAGSTILRIFFKRG